MTPIKEIWVILDSVFALDYADMLNTMANCGTHENALYVATALGQYHRKEVYALSNIHRRMVPVGGSNG